MSLEADLAVLEAASAWPSPSVLGDLAEEDRRAIEVLGRRVRLRRGEHLYLAGEQDPRAMFIERGLVRVMIDLPDGEGALATLVGPDGVPGLSSALAGRPARHSVTAVADTEAFAVSGARLRQLVSDRTHLVAHCFGLLADQAVAMETEIACAATHRIEQRIARLLLTMRRHLGRDHFDLRQEELAQMISVQRTTVSMLAHGLKARGCLGYLRGVIHIKDPAGLAAVSCGCGPGR